MGKYKALITGRNKALISALFSGMDEELIMMTSGPSKADLENHLTYFKPDLFIVCPIGEDDATVTTITDMREYFNTHKISFVLVGNKENTDKFIRNLSLNPDLTINTPLANEQIFDQISSLMIMKDTYNLNQGRKHILVVDDDPMMLKLIKEHLHDDYTVATAVGGRIALKFLETKTTNLILLDYEMPEMNGPEVLNVLRSRENTMNIPIVFLTGTKDRDKVQNALLLKPQGYLLKPIEKDKLLEMIHHILG